MVESNFGWRALSQTEFALQADRSACQEVGLRGLYGVELARRSAFSLGEDAVERAQEEASVEKVSMIGMYRINSLPS